MRNGLSVLVLFLLFFSLCVSAFEGLELKKNDGRLKEKTYKLTELEGSYVLDRSVLSAPELIGEASPFDVKMSSVFTFDGTDIFTIKVEGKETENYTIALFTPERTCLTTSRSHNEFVYWNPVTEIENPPIPIESHECGLSFNIQGLTNPFFPGIDFEISNVKINSGIIDGIYSKNSIIPKYTENLLQSSILLEQLLTNNKKLSKDSLYNGKYSYLSPKITLEKEDYRIIDV